MAAYLANVLEGDVDLALVKVWMSEGSGLPPAPSIATSPRSPTSSDHWPQLTADHFRVLLLNHVKEEADIIFVAAEQHAITSQVIASDKVLNDPTACHAAAQRSRPPGLVDESSFPTLSILPTKVGPKYLLQPRSGT